MASKIKDFINRAKKSMGSRKPPVADARTMHAQRNNGTTGLNTVPNETFAQTEYRAAKINAARDAYSARKAAKAAKSSQQSAAASSTRAPAPSVRAERPDRNPAHHSPEGLTLRYEGSDYGDGNTILPPGAQRAGELRSKSKPKNYPRTTPEEGGGLAPPAAKRKKAPLKSSKGMQEKNVTMSLGEKNHPPQAGKKNPRTSTAKAKPRPKPKATSRPVSKASPKNPRSRITSGRSNSTQSAVRDLTKRRKNKVKGQR